MKPQFNKEYWTNQLKIEAGVSHVPDEDLHKHFILFGTFSNDDGNKVSAKEYIENQLKYLEEQYNSVDANLESDIASLIADVPEKFKSEWVGGESTSIANTEIRLLPTVQQTINRSDIHYYDVVVDGNAFTVAINDHGDDFRIKDQINHVKHTTFFIEERNPMNITGFENIISYYQFANMVQSVVKKNSTDLSAYEKISQNIDTVFDGIKLEGF
jgi:hypothetical protein